jgi:putative peptide zinc metalloprotease protein
VEDALEVAPLRPNLKVRDDLVKVRQVERSEAFYVYKVVETQDYYRVEEFQHAILELFDGTRTLEEVVQEFNAQNPEMPIDVVFLKACVEGLGPTGIFEETREEKKRLFLEKIRDQRRRRVRNRNPFGNIFEITLSAWNPDRFFERVIPRLRFFWTPAFIIVSAACILVMLGIWVAEWERIKEGTIALFTFRDKTGADILQFLLLLLVVGFCHESAHGLTCRYFGGHVNRMGFLFVYFTPCFFVDVSDAYLFPSHFKRQAVIYAGGYFELFLCSLSTFVWALTSPGTLVNELAWKFLLLSGLSSVIINYNPLIKLDGYYSLMDYLEISDLWERSFAYVSGWIRRTIFQLPVEVEAPPRDVRRILVGYCCMSIAYKVLLVAVFLVFLKNILHAMFGGFGYVALALIVALIFRRQILKLASFLRFTVLDKKEVVMTARNLVVLSGAAGSLAAFLALVPVPITIRGDFVLEARSAAIVRAPGEGVIGRVLVVEGQSVGQGEALAVLRNDGLVRSLAVLKTRIDLSEQEIAEAGGSEKRAVLARKVTERDLIREEIRVLEERAEALTLRAPLAGTVITARPEDLVGSYLARGQPFCEIAEPRGLVARVPVREGRIDEVQPGQRVDLKVASFPFRTFQGKILGVAPAASAGEGGLDQGTAMERNLGRPFTDFEVIIGVPGSPDVLRQGMAGTVRIRVGRSTLAYRAGRAFRRWIGSRIW